MNECPDETALLDYAEGRLEAAARAPISAHLQGCESCRDVVDHLTRRTTNPEAAPLGAARAHHDEPTRLVDPLIGALVGEYRVEERIGEGGMGMVYRGVQPVIGKSVAIKVLKPQLLDSPSLLGRLVDEARAANAVGHRNIIDIFSFGALPGGEQYFVMEYLVGTPLSHHLARSGALPAREAVELLVELVSALAAAHAASVAHRDLKPSNLFLVHEPDGKRLLKVLDFGIAKLATTDRPHTQPGAILGTPEYMSPEQVRGEPSGPEADLYAVGVIAFELLAGRRPFRGTTAEVMKQHVEAEPPPLSVYAANAPLALEELVAKLMSKKPAARGTSAQTLEALQALQRTLPASASLEETTEPVGRPLAAGPDTAAPAPRSRKLELAAIGAGLVVAGVLIAVIVSRPGATPRQPVTVVVTQPTPRPEPQPEPAPQRAPEPEPQPAPPPPAPRRARAVDVKARRAELLSQVEALRKASGNDRSAAMLLDDAEKKARAAQSADDVKHVERQLEVVRTGYLKRR